MRHRSPGYSRPHYHERRFSRSPSPRRGGGGGGGGGHYRRARTAPASLLVRNLRRDCTPGDLRSVFKEFGRIRDIYLPRDYYSGEPRGFGFVEYFDPEDAAEAKYQMDRQVLFGREITVVFAEDNRKRPEEMRMKQRSRGGVSRYHDRSRSRSYSRSRSRDRSVSRGRNSKRYSRSRSRSGSGDRERSRSPSRSPSPSRNSRYGSRSRSP